MNSLLAFFGADDKAIEEAKIKRDKMLERKSASCQHYTIPDWTGQGGSVSFWLNADGTFEAEDSRITDASIREGIRNFAKAYA